MIGARRFLERVWRMQEKIQKDTSPDVEKLLHRTIKKVGEDIESFKFNTAISTMMIFVNAAEKEGITKQQHRTFLKLLAPFAPHMAEDLWASRGEKRSIHISPWPQYDDVHLHDDMVTMVIQVNGKVRAHMQVSASISEEEAKTEGEKLIAKWLEGKNVTKMVFVRSRLVNFVVSD
jgi:leucyl-tRNA synthetase